MKTLVTTALLSLSIALSGCATAPLMPAKEDIKRFPVKTHQGAVKLRFTELDGLIPYESKNTILEKVTWFYGNGSGGTSGFFGLSLHKKNMELEVESIKVSEIAGADEIFEFKDITINGKSSRISIETEEEIIKPTTFPWFYKDGDDMLIFKVVVEYKNGKKDNMYQGFNLNQDFKDTLKGKKR
jgi:hypothetical protein